MKIIVLAFAAVCFAQSNLSEPRSGAEPYAVVAHREPTVRYLVEYTTTEPCYECGARYAINCGLSNPGCDIPSKGVPHFEEFDTKAQAIEFLNADMEHRSVTATSTTSSGIVWAQPALSFVQTRLSFPKTFVRLLEIRDIPVDVKSTKVDIPQPPVSQETKHYAVKP